MSPKVSVIIPVYNSERWIARTIRSILNQSLKNDDYEIIVINDGSTDNTLDVLVPFKNEITLINRKNNKGLPYSLNEGISISKGRFLIRLDSDDYVHENYLQIPYLYLTMNPNIDAVSLDYYSVDDHENIIKRHNAEKEPIGCAIMFRQEQMVSIGLYNENQKLHEEVELMERFKKIYNLTRIPLPLYRYRQREDSISNNKELIKIYGKAFNK